MYSDRTFARGQTSGAKGAAVGVGTGEQGTGGVGTGTGGQGTGGEEVR